MFLIMKNEEWAGWPQICAVENLLVPVPLVSAGIWIDRGGR
jgi:hypothetical protein